MSYLAVKNLEHFQHYKTRRPPWIKLYQEVLEDVQFTRLQDASRSHLLSLWLLASRYDNRIPNDAKWIEKAIIASGPVDIAALVSAGFLVVYDDASDALASSPQNARTEERGERTETESSTSSTGLDAVDALMAALPPDKRVSFGAEVNAQRQGMHGPVVPEPQIQRGCADFVSDNAVNGYIATPKLSHFRGYLTRRPPEPSAIRVVTPASADSEALWAKAQAVASQCARGTMSADDYQQLPTRVRTGLQAIGGWTAIRDAKPADIPWRKREFLKAAGAA